MSWNKLDLVNDDPESLIESARGLASDAQSAEVDAISTLADAVLCLAEAIDRVRPKPSKSRYASGTRTIGLDLGQARYLSIGIDGTDAPELSIHCWDRREEAIRGLDSLTDPYLITIHPIAGETGHNIHIEPIPSW